MEQGLVVLVVGMATVFAFLILLVTAMNLSARFFQTFAHWFPEETEPARGTSAAGLPDIAVALAAIRAKTR